MHMKKWSESPGCLLYTSEGAQLYSIVEEGYTNFSTTKAYNLEQAMVEKHRAVNGRQQKVQALSLIHISPLPTHVMSPISCICRARRYARVRLIFKSSCKSSSLISSYSSK